ncbi:gamma-glutamylcyclotransferase [bacterium]|nr:gamma-glutamylcyclotransferase [bacterium]NCQ55480.1 gamma-glutamylcyclotransferase [Candidatus Parcubacteria bacterium]NCS67842.1 gamma-glutamylcyclotransferase [Candidatus Peregrinibacteria bacterium]NCS96344.1 gamma-glutamylcyclotransferase [bacterium]
MENVFSYGTLQDPVIQQKLIGRTSKGAKASLNGFRREEIKIDNSIYWILVPDKNTIEKITGQVFEITTAELKAFDDYEGKEYKRSFVELNTGEAAWVYHQ